MTENNRLLTPEEVTQGINDYYWSEDMPMDTLITRQIYAVALAQDAKTRSATLKEVGEWLARCATVAIEHPSKNVSEATYGFKTKEWHKSLSKLRKGEMPEGVSHEH